VEKQVERQRSDEPAEQAAVTHREQNLRMRSLIQTLNGHDAQTLVDSQSQERGPSRKESLKERENGHEKKRARIEYASLLYHSMTDHHCYSPNHSS
jgi:hypothetical protein